MLFKISQTNPFESSSFSPEWMRLILYDIILILYLKKNLTSRILFCHFLLQTEIQNINIIFKTKFIRYTFQKVEDTGSFVLFKKTAYEYKMIFNWINLVFEKNNIMPNRIFFTIIIFFLRRRGLQLLFISITLYLKVYIA